MGARIKTEQQIKWGQDKKIARKKKTHSQLCCLLWKKEKKKKKSPWLYCPVKQICLTHVNEFGRDFLVKQPQVNLQINQWIEQINPKPSALSIFRLHTRCFTQGTFIFQLATSRLSWHITPTPFKEHLEGKEKPWGQPSPHVQSSQSYRCSAQSWVSLCFESKRFGWDGGAIGGWLEYRNGQTMARGAYVACWDLESVLLNLVFLFFFLLYFHPFFLVNKKSGKTDFVLPLLFSIDFQAYFLRTALYIFLKQCGSPKHSIH